MGVKNIYERFVWFDNQVRAKKYPNTTILAEQFEISTKTAQRDIDADGSLELRFPVSYFSEIKMEILKHGDQVKVIKPKTLRDLIKAEVEKIAKIY